jgi:hypothetical protein
MVRTLIGGLVGGLIIFVMGYVFWATPLGDIPFNHATDDQQVAIQAALGPNLTESGTGTYKIPDPRTRVGASAYTKGPIALVDYNTAGFAPDDMGMLLPGFIVAVITGLLMAFGLAAVGGGGRAFSGVARLVVLYSLGFTVWEFLGTPIFMHFGWSYWIYAFVAESVSLILAGLVIARWFLPRGYVAPSAAAETHHEAPAATTG